MNKNIFDANKDWTLSTQTEVFCLVICFLSYNKINIDVFIFSVGIIPEVAYDQV